MGHHHIVLLVARSNPALFTSVYIPHFYTCLDLMDLLTSHSIHRFVDARKDAEGLT